MPLRGSRSLSLDDLLRMTVPIGMYLMCTLLGPSIMKKSWKQTLRSTTRRANGNTDAYLRQDNYRWLTRSGVGLNELLGRRPMENNMAITKEQIQEWRQEQGNGMTSAVGEYTPAEFWEALDEIERLRAGNAEVASLRARVAELESELAEVYGTP